jgi:putative chitinase
MTLDKAAFYTHLRAKLGRLSVLQVEGFESILAAIDDAPLSHQAYMLATAWHETAATMQPVREAFHLSENWRKKNLRYWPWYGRGLVQITWERNYRKLDEACAQAGLTEPGEILKNPDLAMRPDIAAFALRRGMEEGWYDSNGKKMSQRLPMKGVATREQYIDARRLVNVQDKADMIEDYAQIFERALRNGGVS